MEKKTSGAEKTSKTRRILRSKERDFETLYEAHGRLGKKLKLIEGTANLFLNVGDVERNVEKVMDFCMAAVDAEAGSILLIDEDACELYFAAARGPKAKAIKAMRLRLDQGIAGASASGKETIAVSDVRRDSRFSREIDKALGFETRSILAVPIIFKSTSLGTIEIINKRGSDRFAAEEIELVADIARLLGALLAIGDRVRRSD